MPTCSDSMRRSSCAPLASPSQGRPPAVTPEWSSPIPSTRRTTGGAFNFIRNARPDYNLAIERLSKDDCLAKMRRMEHSWAVGTSNQSRIRPVEVGTRNLILANVKSTWVQELSVPGTFYTGVPVRTILDHLGKDGSGLDRPTGVELIIDFHKL